MLTALPAAPAEEEGYKLSMFVRMLPALLAALAKEKEYIIADYIICHNTLYYSRVPYCVLH